MKFLVSDESVFEIMKDVMVSSSDADSTSITTNLSRSPDYARISKISFALYSDLKFEQSLK
ncbi:17070_t:CDS:2, partial [Cetraspora pellucida]